MEWLQIFDFIYTIIVCLALIGMLVHRDKEMAELEAKLFIVSRDNELLEECAAELEAKVDALRFSLDEVGTRNLKAGAIREMVNNAKQFTHNPSSIKVSTILEYANNLEKEE